MRKVNLEVFAEFALTTVTIEYAEWDKTQEIPCYMEIDSECELGELYNYKYLMEVESHIQDFIWEKYGPTVIVDFTNIKLISATD